MAKDYTIAYLLDLYGPALTEKQRNLVDYYYNEDLSLSEISENEGITRQGARDSIKRAENQLREWEDKLGLLRQRQRREEAAGRLQTAASQALVLLGQPGREAEVRARLREILQTAEGLQDPAPGTGM